MDDHWELDTIRLQHGPCDDYPRLCKGCDQSHPCPSTDLADAYEALVDDRDLLAARVTELETELTELRERASGRRRPDGDPAREYVMP